MHLLLVRHGQSANNVIEKEVGDGGNFDKARVPDPALSELGFKQAEALGKSLSEKLQNETSVRLIVSGMRRALQTIQPLSRELAIPPLVRPDTFERNGMFTKSGTEITQCDGLTAEEIQDEFSGFNVSELEAGWGRVETDEECFERAGRVAASLREMALVSPPTDVVVFVSHMDFLDHLFKKLMGLPRGAAWMKLDNVSISHLVLRNEHDQADWGSGEVDGECDTQAATVIKWNSTSHLEPALRSGVMWKTMRIPETSWLI